jgi:membrane protein implicated in regulation of membrane protease activity
MLLFWLIIAIIFLIIELLTLTFGFIFLTIGALFIMILISFSVISSANISIQLSIILFSMILSFIFFMRTYKKLKNKSDNNFIEDMNATVIENDLVKNIEGKVRWSGTIVNALIDENSNFDKFLINESVTIKKFVGNTAIIDK